MKLDKLPQGKKVILFDGVCNLCNGAVQYVIDHDQQDMFRFAALQSEIGQELLAHIGVDIHETDSIILYDPNGNWSAKSAAAIAIAAEFGGFFKATSFLKIFPTRLCDLIYDLVARNRYKWFGRRDHCMIPTPELQAKFL